MEKEFDFRIAFDKDSASNLLKAKYHEGTFGRNIYNVYSLDGKEFLFEASVKEVEQFIKTNHWIIEKITYSITEEDGKFIVTLHKECGGTKKVAECYELQYAELLVSCLSE